MGLYIEGMEMPKSCKECKFWSITSCIASYQGEKSCPLTEVPEPHGRLIDAEQLKETLDYYIREAGWSDEINKALSWVKDGFIDSEPTVIPASEEGVDEAQRDYERAVEDQQYCEMYETTYDPETGAM